MSITSVTPNFAPPFSSKPNPSRTNFSDHINDFTIAAFLYLPTLFFVPHYFYLIAVFLIISKSKNIIFQKRDIFLFLFCIFSFINIFFHADSFSWENHGSSVGTPLVIITALSARVIRDKTWSWLIAFVCCEVAVGIFEYSVGQVALFSAQVSQTGQEIFTNSELLYDIRVYGLSDNSSVLAEKIFLSILVLIYNSKISISNALKLAILFIGLYVSFNRTAILSTIILLFLIFFLWSTKNYKRIPILISVSIAAIIVFFSIYNEIVMQFTRGSGTSSYSEESRFFFIISSLQHVYQNPIWGNGSLTFRVFDPTTYTFQHAHNSIIMMIATHGIVVSFTFFLFLFGGIRKDSLIFVLVMIIFSLTQYSFFWNISLSDFVLHYFLRGPGASQGDGRSISTP